MVTRYGYPTDGAEIMGASAEIRGGFVVHGAFTDKADAEKRERERPGAFIRKRIISRGRLKGQTRYFVFTVRGGTGISEEEEWRAFRKGWID